MADGTSDGPFRSGARPTNGGSGRGGVEPLLGRELAELLTGPRLDLADPLLADPQLLAELAEGLLAGAQGVAGATLLGDGRILIVLDLQELAG